MDLNATIKRIDELKKEIDQFRPLVPATERRIFQKFRLDWNYNSNAIEGNQLTLGETKAFLLHGITAKGKPFKDYLDIKGHNEAIDYLIDFVQQKATLSEAVIRELHKILLVEPYKVPAITPSGEKTERWISIGDYKKHPNHVETRTGEIHYYATPEETPAKMGDLMQWYRKNEDSLHPVNLAAIFHYEFVAIHPFDDGNGRMARLLMNLILMQKGYIPVVVKLDHKADYLLALEKADAGELEDFIHLIAEELIQSMELYLRGARGESIEEDTDFNKKIELLERRLKVNEVLNHPERNKDLLEGIKKSIAKPFLKKLQTNISKFDRLFLKKSNRLFVGTYEYGRVESSNVQYSYKENSNAFETTLEKFSHFGTEYDWFEIRYLWKEILKGKPSNIDITLRLYFRFDKHQFEVAYEINYGSKEQEDQIIKDYYDASFDEVDIDAIVTKISNQLLEKIEAAL